MQISSVAQGSSESLTSSVTAAVLAGWAWSWVFKVQLRAVEWVRTEKRLGFEDTAGCSKRPSAHHAYQSYSVYLVSACSLQVVSFRRTSEPPPSYSDVQK